MFFLQSVDSVDLSTFAGIAAVTTVLVSVLKMLFPALIVDRERFAAVVISLALAVASKLTGLGFQNTNWIVLVITGIIAGPAAGVLYQNGTAAFKPASVKQTETVEKLQTVLHPETIKEIVRPEVAEKVATRSIPIAPLPGEPQ